jgi:hypothetical protein
MGGTNSQKCHRILWPSNPDKHYNTNNWVMASRMGFCCLKSLLEEWPACMYQILEMMRTDDGIKRQLENGLCWDDLIRIAAKAFDEDIDIIMDTL